MKMHSHESLGQRDHNNTTYTQFGLRAFRHENPCISRVSARFFSGHLIDTKIILNKLLGQHGQNDVSYTQIGPQMRKLSLIEVLTFRVPVSLNVHAYIGLYLTHACQKYFWKAEKSFFLLMHVPQCMAKRGKLKKVKKKKKKKKKNVLNNPKCSVGRHSNFSKQCQPALIYLILVPTSTRILKHSAGQHCVPKPPSALFLSFFQ